MVVHNIHANKLAISSSLQVFWHFWNSLHLEKATVLYLLSAMKMTFQVFFVFH